MITVPTLQLKELSYKDIIPKVTNFSRGVEFGPYSVVLGFTPVIASVPASLGWAPHSSTHSFSSCAPCVPAPQAPPASWDWRPCFTHRTSLQLSWQTKH